MTLLIKRGGKTTLSTPADGVQLVQVEEAFGNELGDCEEGLTPKENLSNLLPLLLCKSAHVHLAASDLPLHTSGCTTLFAQTSRRNRIHSWEKGIAI